MSIDRRNAAGWVAIILALAVGLALNVVTTAILYASYVRVGYDVNAGISENGTQLLTGAFGGIIGALSAYLGYMVGKKEDSTGERNTSGSQKNSSQESIHQGS